MVKKTRSVIELYKLKNATGIYIALIIVLLWFLNLATGLQFPISFKNPVLFLLILLQTHLYTGLFITAHDAMHGGICKNKVINKAFGIVAAGLFAFNNYQKLFTKHHEHHRFVATDKDPDYHEGPLLLWYFNFLKQYVTWYQLVLMAITYNILVLFFAKENVIVFWIIPSLLSTFQLFYFGTYLPHSGQHAPDNKHRSRSFRRNHFLAFLTCYFFGYHYEHHNAPHLPWWKLYKEKTQK